MIRSARPLLLMAVLAMACLLLAVSVGSGDLGGGGPRKL